MNEPLDSDLDARERAPLRIDVAWVQWHFQQARIRIMRENGFVRAGDGSTGG